MSPKSHVINDLDTAKRLQVERKKIWKSRKNFRTDTGISDRSLENWESNGIDIPSSALREIAKRGGDIYYIITGERNYPSLAHNEAQLEVSDTCAEFANYFDSLSRHLRNLSIEVLKDPESVQTISSEIDTLREALEKLQGQQKPH